MSPPAAVPAPRRSAEASAVRRTAGSVPDGEAGGADADAAAGDGSPTVAEWTAAVEQVRGLPADATVLLACHVNPDGDALGSMLGFGLGMRQLGLRNVVASFPGPFELPEPFRAMPGHELLVPAAEAPHEPDLMLCFDAASANRLGELADRIGSTTIVLDHHASNTRFGGIHLVDPTAAATSVVADGLLTRLGVNTDVRIAECLYVALATDTGSFRFDMTTPAVHEFAARLLATGISPAEISRRIFDSRPFGAVRLYGEVLGRAQLEPGAAGGLGLVWTYATLDDLARHGQRPYVLEPLIDSVRCTDEADVACVVKQIGEAEWAVSMRSKGGVNVARVAVALGGGGHRLAAGFTGRGSATEVVAAIRDELNASTVRDQG